MAWMEHMQQDCGEDPADREEVDKPAAGWRAWVSEPRRLLASVAGIVAFGLLLGYVIAALFIFPARTSSVDLRRVPEVVGLTADEARELIEQMGLTAEEEAGLYHSSAVGTVVAQEPLGGQMAQPGSAVELVTSLGPKLSPVPDVVGLGHSQAEIALARAGYESELDWVDADADVGQVVDTRPAPGTPLQLPGTVRLFVSAGPRRAPVPNLVTRSLSEARATLERLGLRLGDVRQDSASLAAPGTVLAQTPAAGTIVDRASRVRVTVAKMPQPDQSRDTTAMR
jgi:serine/threonine-protein kinase